MLQCGNASPLPVNFRPSFDESLILGVTALVPALWTQQWLPLC